MSRKLTTEEFITKAREKHGDKYIYDDVLYKNNRTPVRIICPKHGAFIQVAGEHLRGHGCPKCNRGILLSHDEFMERAHEKYGEKFDYSKTKYVNSHTKITVMCRLHGEFEVMPLSHLEHGGCPVCKKEKRIRKISKEEFISLSKTIHGSKYDYSKLNESMGYYDELVTLICPVHGEFSVTPYAHLVLKRGCVKCNFRGLSSEEWIERFCTTHGDTYDYSKFEYKGNNIKSTIICKKHGEFQQTPYSHVSGQGCPICKWDKIRQANTKTTEEFIQEARAIHGDKYDYSKTVYVDSKTPVIIICPEHGEFTQIPTTHICQRSGCKKCATENDTPRKRDTKKSFIEKAIKIHGNKYDYSMVDYIDTYTPVKIICREHGIFLQKPNSHLNGRGCIKCGNHKTELKICEILDSLGIDYLYEKTIDWLVYKSNQRLDFYFPQYKAAIEYQGEEHFFPVDYAGKGYDNALKIFNIVKKRDANKLNLCNKNGVKLFYINYYDNITEKLKEILSEMQKHR